MVSWSEILISLCAQLCLFALQASMLTTAIEMQQNGNEKRLSSAPYLCLLVNCTVWTIYASMRGYVALFIPNAIGVFIGFYCSLLYQQFSRIPIPIVNLAAAAAMILLTIILEVAGLVGVVALFAVIMSSVVYASPLATIMTVIEDKSTASLPFHTSLLVWIGAAFWTLYGGLVTRDIAVLVPSVAGLIMASIQLFMFILFGFPPQESVSPIQISATSKGTVPVLPHSNYLPVPSEPKVSDPAYQELKSYQQQNV